VSRGVVHQGGGEETNGEADGVGNMRLAILADTHIPDREREIPASFLERIEAADHVIHAGDFTSREVLEDLQERATELTAVRGNMDAPGELDATDLPEVATVEAGEVTVVATHGTVASPEEWYDAVAEATREAAAEPRVGIGAHTHQLEDRVHEGIRLLNPGSATGAAPATRATMLTAAVEGSDVEVTVHEP
jgi:putative phosphoesterase